MSDKRKGPPRKAEVVAEAVSLGLGDTEELGKLTVAVLKNKISDALLEEDYDGEESETQIGPEVDKFDAAVDRYNGQDDCIHEYFRRVRIIESPNSYLVEICKHCGFKHRMG